MRTAVVLSGWLLVLGLPVPPVEAGTARLASLDRSGVAGGTLKAVLELVNDSGKPAKFKIQARVVADPDRSWNKASVKGAKVKRTFRLEAGETRRVEVDLPVPAGALGPVRIECKVRGPKAKVRFDEAGVSLPASGGEPDLPPDGEGPARVLTLTGTVSLARVPGPIPMEGAEEELFPYLVDVRFRTEEGASWILIGPEAMVLASLMREAGLEETKATVTGYPADVVPFLEGKGKHLRSAARPRLFWLLTFDARGVEDPRERIVPHRFVLAERLSKMTEARELVVQTEDEWERMLASAGIRLPEEFPWLDGEAGTRRAKGPAGGARRGRGRPGASGEERPGGAGPDRPVMWPPRPGPHEVDFDRETVIAVFAGERRSSGFRVEIVRVTREDDGTLLVAYAVREPSDYEVVIEVPTSPFAVVAIPKTDRRVRFELTDERPDPFPLPGMPEWGGMKQR